MLFSIPFHTTNLIKLHSKINNSHLIKLWSKEDKWLKNLIFPFHLNGIKGEVLF